jgi:hypothetical protein
MSQRRFIHVLRLFFALLVLTVAGRWAVQSQETQTVYLAEAASLRACARQDCAPVLVFPASTPLTVLGTTSDQATAGAEDWLHVREELSGAEGYVPRALTLESLPQDWQAAPVIPTVSEAAREVYRRGQELGNDPHTFSVIGDCQNIAAYFLAAYDDPLQYNLGDYAYLQATIDAFAGAFSRPRAAVQPGYNVASVLSPLWADPDLCDKGENPLQCEYRLHRPAFVIISMETWWSGRPADDYERYLRQVVQFWIDHGVVPILATKADNLEGDHSINAAIVRVARETDMPLWNFWLAVQPLPAHGLEDDGFHLTFARSFFNSPDVLQTGWGMRNLTALQALDAVRRGVEAVP